MDVKYKLKMEKICKQKEKKNRERFTKIKRNKKHWKRSINKVVTKIKKKREKIKLTKKKRLWKEKDGKYPEEKKEKENENKI